MITSSVLFGIAIALSGSITISSFEFGNATDSIKGNQFIDTLGPCIVKFLELGKNSHQVNFKLIVFSVIVIFFI